MWELFSSPNWTDCDNIITLSHDLDRELPQNAKSVKKNFKNILQIHALQFTFICKN